MRAVAVAVVLFLAPSTVRAQSAADLVARGQAARDARDLPAALAAFEAALAVDSLDAAANWKAALTLVDMGKVTPDSVKDPARDALYARAEVLARRATIADPGSADAHFVLANAVGRASLTKSKKERVRRAVEIREEALKALSIDHRHDGAYHVLGRWNAEIMRLSGVERFFAKSFMGGKVFGEGSWDEAVKYLERAVSLKPSWIYHRLDLAQIYVDRGRYADARQQLMAIPDLPPADASDEQYKRDAAALLQRIEGKS
jgi:tetratricopeptide (TPR) repeat protein